ncbi:nitroreductase family protein [Desulfosporosinus sp. SB140]|uniref:nitroreductase family protein n=1 Tax=Desulfosporosinus paludis TaxID=3115649 RepID=UPI003890EA51
MDTFEAISQRRSIRKYKSEKVSREQIERILEAAVLAPSGKNRQPWRFIVIEGKKKDDLISLLFCSEKERKSKGVNTGSFSQTITAMNQAPVVIMVLNSYFDTCIDADGQLNHNRWLTDVQGIAAAIQNMLLTAQDQGLGTLWVCDIYYAEEEIRTWLNTENQLIAAICLGYANEKPFPRPRVSWKEVTDWLD